MPPLRGRLLAALLLLSLLPPALSSPGGLVVDLTPSTFDAHASAHPLLLVEFYVPYSFHCRHFARSYESVAERLASAPAGGEAGLSVSVARVDGSAHRLLAQRFRIRGLPSFYLVNGGAVTEFAGPRTVDALVAFARSRGETHGRKRAGALGPFHLYWRAVGGALAGAERVRGWVEERPENLKVAAAAGVLSVVGVVVAFALFVHVITMPAAARPHAE